MSLDLSTVDLVVVDGEDAERWIEPVLESTSDTLFRRVLLFLPWFPDELKVLDREFQFIERQDILSGSTQGSGEGVALGALNGLVLAGNTSLREFQGVVPVTFTRFTEGPEGVCRFYIRELARWVPHAGHALCLQSFDDAFNPIDWSDELLDWDYIGEPALSLRSRQFLAHGASWLYDYNLYCPETEKLMEKLGLFLRRGLKISDMPIIVQILIGHTDEGDFAFAVSESEILSGTHTATSLHRRL